MSRALHKLINALTIVLVRYHDSQDECEPRIVLGSSSYKNACIEYATKLLATENYAEELKRINEKATSSYRLRLRLLNYIKDEIVILKTLSTRTKPFSEVELEEYTKKITQLFVDIINLLNVPKIGFYSVHTNELNGKNGITISLNGLLDKGMGYLKSTMCRSGVLLEEEVLTLFHIMKTEEVEEILPEIRAVAEEICFGHQDFILAKLTQRAHEETQTIKREHEIALQSQIEEHEKTKTKLDTTQLELVSTKKDLIVAQEKIEHLQEEIEQLQEENKTQQRQLEESKAQLAVITTSKPSPTQQDEGVQTPPTELPPIFRGMYTGLTTFNPVIPYPYYARFKQKPTVAPKNDSTSDTSSSNTFRPGGPTTIE